MTIYDTRSKLIEHIRETKQRNHPEQYNWRNTPNVQRLRPLLPTMSDSKLFTLTKLPRFLERWNTGENLEGLLGMVAYTTDFTPNDFQALITAWTRQHQNATFNTARISDSIEASRYHKNAKRRERRKNKMTTSPKRGRPIKADSLRNKILNHLQGAPSNPQRIAFALNTTQASVESQVYRLKMAGLIVSHGNGLYELAERQTTAASKPDIERKPEPDHFATALRSIRKTITPDMDSYDMDRVIITEHSKNWRGLGALDAFRLKVRESLA